MQILARRIAPLIRANTRQFSAPMFFVGTMIAISSDPEKDKEMIYLGYWFMFLGAIYP